MRSPYDVSPLTPKFGGTVDRACLSGLEIRTKIGCEQCDSPKYLERKKFATVLKNRNTASKIFGDTVDRACV